MRITITLTYHAEYLTNFSDNQKILLEKCLSVVERIPPVSAAGSADENAWKNCWNWNLTDAAYGQLVLDIKEGRVNAEMKSQGFNYAYRRQTTPTSTSGAAGAPVDGLTAQPNATNPASATGTKPATPVPMHAQKPAPPHIKSPASATSPAVSKAATPAPAENEPVGSAPSKEDREKEKREKKKQKEKEKKAEKAAERAAAAEANSTKKDDGTRKGEKRVNGAPKLELTASEGVAGEEGGSTLSPGGAEGSVTGGAQTPTGRRGSRNPWTLFVKHLPVPITEEEIKDFFGEAKSGVRIWSDFFGLYQ